MFFSRFFLVVLSINFIYTAPLDNKRKLEVFINPDCQNAHIQHNTTDFDIVYVKASSANDTLHYILSNLNAPTLIGVQTFSDVNLCLDWDNIFMNSTNISSAISFTDSGIPENAMAMYIPHLFEMVDIKDEAKLEPDNMKPISWDKFKWDHVKILKNDGNMVLLEFRSNNQSEPNIIMENGSVSLKFQLYSNGGRLNEAPSLINSFNSTQMFVTLNQLRASNASSRFGFQLALEYPHNHTLKFNEDEHMDDEKSPGVFKVLSLKDYNNPDSGYVFWKPVSYLDPNHIVTKSTDATYFNLKNVTLDLDNVLTPFKNNSEQFPFEILLGMIDDGFYVKHNYTSWTAVLGFGDVPAEHTSLLAQLLFAIGMGIPLIIMIAASIYACKKHYSSSSQDERLLP